MKSQGGIYTAFEGFMGFRVSEIRGPSSED